MQEKCDMDKNFKRFVFGTNPIRNQIMAKPTNSANKNISQDVLNNLEICLPLIEEQHKVGAFFAQLDNLITLHQ
jgi:type I restriction enzyme S subunit